MQWSEATSRSAVAGFIHDARTGSATKLEPKLEMWVGFLMMIAIFCQHGFRPRRQLSPAAVSRQTHFRTHLHRLLSVVLAGTTKTFLTGRGTTEKIRLSGLLRVSKGHMNMRHLTIPMLGILIISTSQFAGAAQITGEYLEARTCNVYTGPCFANAEMSLSGKEALMAWKVDQGSWNDVQLDGLGAALILHAQGTLGYDGVFPMQAGKVKSVLLIDEQASPEQQDALIAFVKTSTKDLSGNVVHVERVPFELNNDHIDNVGVFKAGELAEIRTRKLQKGDCVCTNEVVYYQPLTKIDNASPAYSLKLSWQGEKLGTRFTNRGIRSAFLGTFRK